VGDLWEKFQLASAKVPFRVKTGATWVVVFLILAFVGSKAGFDLAWMREKFPYILGGARYTIQIAVFGIILAVIFALLGALARLSRNPIAQGLAVSMSRSSAARR
jgi:polar amino acid transport system permease protein